MPLDTLDIGATPRLTGRKSTPVTCDYAGELVPSDIVLLASERGEQKPKTLINGLRERHHQLARCLGRGMSDYDAAAVTGYTVSRISILRRDPAFAELVAHYNGVKDFAFADFQERAAAVAIDGLNIIADRMEEDPDAISVSMALEIVKQLADRTGHSAVAKSVNVNVNANMTARLTAARNRVAQAYATEDVPPGSPAHDGP